MYYFEMFAEIYYPLHNFGSKKLLRDDGEISQCVRLLEANLVIKVLNESS